MSEIYILLAIILGFCLGRFGEIKKLTQEVLPALEKKISQKYKFSVISTDEVELVKEQKETDGRKNNQIQ